VSDQATPTLSIILPVYNGARFLKDALRSALEQQHPSFEILIIDDGSTDNTPAIVAATSGPIRYFRQENRGPSAARNRGIRLARGSVLAFLDADDLWPPGKLARQLPVLAAQSSTDIVMGLTQPMLMTDPGCDDSPLTPVLSPRLTLSVGACLYRPSVFERFGYFDEGICGAEDLDWLLRARESGAWIHIVPAVTLCYRENPESLTHAMSASQLDFFRILKRSIDRRRHAGIGLTPLDGGG
jgi:glycosyltransferase involved in cell wall biosynthesis